MTKDKLQDTLLVTEYELCQGYHDCTTQEQVEKLDDLRDKIKEMKKYEALKASLGTGCKVTPNKYPNVAKKIRGISTHPNGEMIVECGNLGDDYLIEDVKPHYFPLSCLVKPIVVKGYNDKKAFIPATHLFSNPLQISALASKIKHIGDKCINPKHLRGWQLDLLDEWKFNRFKLDPSDYIDASESKAYEWC